MVQMRSSRYWDKRAIARLTEAERNSEWHFREIKILYEEAEKDTVASLKAIYESFYRENKFDMTALNKIVPTAEVEKFYADMKAAGLSKYLPKRFTGRVKRLEMINAQLWSRTKQLAILENEIETKSHIETINGAFGKTIYDTAKGIGATPAFEQLNSRGIEVLLNTPWQGANYSKRIWGNSNTLANQLQQTLTKAIMTGMSEERALYEIRQRFNVGNFYAERLIRTETNHFENETEFIAYQEMGIDQYVFVATLDGRTSDMCRSHDGQIYKMSERQEGYNYPPLHPFCRSTVRGYIGKEYEPKMRAARNKLGGKYFVPNMSYNEWIKDVRFNPNVHPADVPTIMP
ncbi:minor capsid protein [Candidatus Saccharibacteria bacterium]|nr:minor capsid protein [Candidatus Saccharibacteria bacterium]